MSTSGNLKIEVVMIGYVDPRINTGAPFGFAMKAAQRVIVHHRTDLTNFGLPQMFEFTAKNLPAIIMDRFKSLGKKADVKTPLHEFLVKNCFDGLGSFRCWQPIQESISPEDLDAFVIALRGLVDRAMSDYQSKLDEFKASCDPGWRRLPELQKTPQMPALNPAMA